MGLLTVCITTDSQLALLLDLHLDHGGLLVDNVLDSEQDLVDILLMDALAILESLNHVVNKLLCHLVSKLHAIVAVIYHHVVQIQTLGGGWCVCDLDGLEEGVALDNLLAGIMLQFCRLVAGLLLDDNLPVVDGVCMSENGRVGHCSSVVSLDEIAVEFYRLGGIGHSITV